MPPITPTTPLAPAKGELPPRKSGDGKTTPPRATTEALSANDDGVLAHTALPPLPGHLELTAPPPAMPIVIPLISGAGLGAREQAILHALHTNPSPREVIAALRFRLNLSSAEQLCATLRDHGVEMQPYDFPNTIGVWEGKHENGELLGHHAIRALLESLGRDAEVDVRTVPGFRAILPRLGKDIFAAYAINEWGTTLRGLFNSHGSSTSTAILDFIDHDPEFHAIRTLRGYDFPAAPQSTWKTAAGKPSDLAREVTKIMLLLLAEDANADPKTFAGFKKVLPLVKNEVFHKRPINEWGTTLGGMLANAYGESASRAVCDLVEHDPDFAIIKQIGIKPRDFPNAPKCTWREKKTGEPTDDARELTGLILDRLAARLGADPSTIEGFAQILPHWGIRLFSEKLNVWDTTGKTMLTRSYGGSPSGALFDLLEHDPRFALVLERGIDPLELKKAPNGSQQSGGIATDGTIRLTRKLVELTGEHLGVDPTTQEGFTAVEQALTGNRFRTEVLGAWGATCKKVFTHVYRESPSSALRDLISRDEDFGGLHLARSG